MANITIRNIPEDIFIKIKKLSEIERRSINNELLCIIEKGTSAIVSDKINESKNISKSTQIKMWKNLSAVWEDKRTTDEIISDIYKSRTVGREIEL